MKATVLTPEQAEQLRREPLGEAPNKLAAALWIARRTQQEFAALVGMTPSDVSQIRNGRYRRLSLETAQRIAVVFGVSTDDIFPYRPKAAKKKAGRTRKASPKGPQGRLAQVA